MEITREGDSVILRPRKSAPWAKLKAALEDLDEAEIEIWFPEGREQPAAPEQWELERLLEA